jgi:hypothetical protein
VESRTVVSGLHAETIEEAVNGEIVDVAVIPLF